MAEEDLDDMDFGDDGDDLNLDADLEDIMGSELEDDGGDGGDDNELDSFFEDLSSIEDLDEDDDGGGMDDDPFDDEPAPAPTPKAAPAAAAAPAATEAAPEAASSSGSGIGKKLFNLLVALILVGGSGFAAWWFWLSNDASIFEETGQLEQELTVSKSEVENTTNLSVEPPPVEPPAPPAMAEKPKAKPKPKAQAKPKKIKRVKASPGGRYLVQVASCTFDDCKSQFASAIRRKGFPVYYSKQARKFDFIELTSRQVYSRPEADRLVAVINKENKWAGFASLIKKPNGFYITMGTFPHLERAKEIKFQLEKLFPNEEIVFNLELVQKSMDETTKVYAGPFNSKKVAGDVLKRLKTNPMFKQSFVTGR